LTATSFIAINKERLIRERMTEYIVKEITENLDKIFANVDRESIEVYRFLKSEYEKGNILDNYLFQFVYRSFYRLDSAGLSEKIKTRYFELLSEKQNDLEIILSELYDIPTLKDKNSIQFSFATKLLHTLDNDNPIYDKNVDRVIRIKIDGKTKDEKIRSSVDMFNSLIIVYSEMMEKDEIIDAILRFRMYFNVQKEKVSDVKVLDFIIWTLGKMKSS
jgi:hypothetical protein